MSGRAQAIGLLVLSSVVCGCATGLSFGNDGTGIMLGYEPVQATTLDILPPAIRDVVTRCVDERLGPAFQRKVRLARVHVVDLQRVRQLNPAWAAWDDFESRIPAYAISYRYSEPDKGLKAYHTRLGLDRNGRVIEHLGLPRVADEPGKADIISVKMALEIARKAGFESKAEHLWFQFSEKVGSMIWVTERLLADQSDSTFQVIEVLEIDAHSAGIVRRYVRTAITVD